MFEEKKLTEEDQERVNSYLTSGFNSVESSPFRPLRLLVLVWVVVAILGFVSWYIGKQAGYL